MHVPRGAALHAPAHHAGRAPVRAPQRRDLRAEAAVAALVERVGRGGALGRQRPRGAGRASARGELRVDVEQQNVLGTLAQGVRDAVHAGVAAAHHHHALALCADHAARRGLAERAALGGGHGAVALVEVLHGEVHTGQLAAGNLEVTMHARADCDDHGVVVAAQLVGAHVAAHVHVVAELDPLLLEQVHAPVDDPLLELGVGHAEAQQPARALVALVDRDAVPELVQLGGHPEAGGSGADHGDGAIGADVGRVRRYPALLETARDYCELDLLDRDRVVVDVEHAGRLTRRRADQPGELGEVVGRVELRERVAPVVPVDEVVPVRDQVAERAALVAERDSAVHAAGALVAQGAVVRQGEVLAVVADPLGGIALVEAHPLEAEEGAQLAHV